MTIVSDIATQSVIQGFVNEILEEMSKNAGNKEVHAVLKRLGRYALSQFEWDTPKWAQAFKEAFKETK